MHKPFADGTQSAYVAAAHARVAALSEPLSLAGKRRAALKRFEEHGFPRVHDEQWRWTPIAELTASFLPPAEQGGWTVGELPAGVELAPFSEQNTGVGDVLARLEERRPFAELNGALFVDGLLVRVRAGARIAAPLVLTARAQAGASHFPRLLIVAEPGSEATIVERYEGTGAYLTSPVTEVVVSAGAVLNHVRVQHDAREAHHVAEVAVHQERDASYRSHVFSIGALLSRIDLDVILDGEGAEAQLYGLYVGSGKQHLDHASLIDHRSPRATSVERYRGILAGASRGVFDGRVRVRPNAQKTNAAQENRNLILSRDALAHTKPSLEIDADDVKCSHAATVGQLDEDALFYLRARGIGEDAAKAILTAGFARWDPLESTCRHASLSIL